jgi:hypothetical protein
MGVDEGIEVGDEGFVAVNRLSSVSKETLGVLMGSLHDQRSAANLPSKKFWHLLSACIEQ